LKGAQVGDCSNRSRKLKKLIQPNKGGRGLTRSCRKKKKPPTGEENNKDENRKIENFQNKGGQKSIAV